MKKRSAAPFTGVRRSRLSRNRFQLYIAPSEKSFNRERAHKGLGKKIDFPSLLTTPPGLSIHELRDKRIVGLTHVPPKGRLRDYPHEFAHMVDVGLLHRAGIRQERGSVWSRFFELWYEGLIGGFSKMPTVDVDISYKKMREVVRATPGSHLRKKYPHKTNILLMLLSRFQDPKDRFRLAMSVYRSPKLRKSLHVLTRTPNNRAINRELTTNEDHALSHALLQLIDHCQRVERRLKLRTTAHSYSQRV